MTKPTPTNREDIDEILHWLDPNATMEANLKNLTKAKAKLENLIIAERIDELQKLRDKFFYDPNGNYIGAQHQMGIASSVKQIHEIIDTQISTLKKQQEK